jgi:hypothetical protein
MLSWHARRWMKSRRCARPSFVFEDWPITFDELPVEPAVVRDDDYRVADESGDGGLVYPKCLTKS